MNVFKLLGNALIHHAQTFGQRPQPVARRSKRMPSGHKLIKKAYEAKHGRGHRRRPEPTDMIAWYRSLK